MIKPHDGMLLAFDIMNRKIPYRRRKERQTEAEMKKYVSVCRNYHGKPAKNHANPAILSLTVNPCPCILD